MFQVGVHLDLVVCFKCPLPVGFGSVAFSVRSHGSNVAVPSGRIPTKLVTRSTSYHVHF